MSRRLPQFDCAGFARGWFVISFSDELAVGGVRALRYFDKDLVLFRTASGAAQVLDAHCPHMGAHFGYGGRVQGEHIVCPFHAWEFRGDGQCATIPYATKIPAKAKTRCWPVLERNGMIPVLPEYGDATWTRWHHSMLEVRTHPSAIVENVADTAHFVPVHGTHVEKFETVYDAHTATQLNSGVAYPLGGGKDTYTIRATYHGPAYQVSHMQANLNGVLLNAHTPIDADTLHLRFGVMIETRDDDKTRLYADGFVSNLRDGFLQDVRIWETKRYLERPSLAEGDGPIMKVRKWYRQFYQNVSDV
jgi:3-ketosteroid 9alpha-monooxygenase subunit A